MHYLIYLRTPPLDGEVARSHCRRACRMGIIVILFGKYFLPQGYLGHIIALIDALPLVLPFKLCSIGRYLLPCVDR